MANEPRGPKGPSDPRGPHRIVGIDDRRFSDRELTDYERLAEQDKWWEARNAFAPGNRPVIFRQLNPLLIPEPCRDWPEFWTVYVPRTRVAWNARQIIRDFQDRVPTDALDHLGNSDNPTPEEYRQAQRAREDQAALELALRNRQLAMFGSAAEAERFAQQEWRKYWSLRLPKQSLESRQRFQQDAVITPIRHEVFTVDERDPAHVMQYEIWRAQYPEGLPLGVLVHRRRVDVDALAIAPRRSPALDPDNPWTLSEPDRAEWEVRSGTATPAGAPPRETWTIYPAGPQTFILARPSSDGSWEFKKNGAGKVAAFDAPNAKRVAAMAPADIRAVPASPDDPGPDPALLDPNALAPGSGTLTSEPSWEIRSIGERTWVLTRYTAQGQWDFWANATGKVVAFDAPSAEAVLPMIPHDVPVVVGRPEEGVPDAEALKALWELARDHAQRFSYHPAVSEWLAAEQTVGRTLKAVMAEDPRAAQRLKPVFNAVVRIHSLILPPDGLVATDPGQLTQAYDQLDQLAKSLMPPGPTRDRLVDGVQFWRRTAGALSLDSLGLFKHGRVADIHFADYDVESVARVDGTGDWVAHRTPSGAFLLARLNHHGMVAQVDLAVYRDERAVRTRVADQGGYLSFADVRAVRLTKDNGRPVVKRESVLVQRWHDAARKAFGSEEADRRLAQLMTPARVSRQVALDAGQAADPTPVRPEAAKPSRALYVTPLGGGRALVWQEPTDSARKDRDPEFVVWDKNGALVSLNKHHGSWLPPAAPGQPARVWAEIPEHQKPWVVESTDPSASLADLARQAAERVPDATVAPKFPMGGESLIRALAERYGLKPEPLSANKEALWVVHPAPGGKTMLSTREWVVEEKPQYPGEYLVYAPARPLRRADGTIALFDSPAAVVKELEAMGIAYDTRATMPPEVGDWFNHRLIRSARETPAIRWGPIDPLTALTHAHRMVRSSALWDLREEQREKGLPPEIKRMQRQLFAGAARNLRAEDFEAILPDAPQAAGVTWQEAEAEVRAFARRWLEERPTLAERLTRPAPAPRPRRASSPASMPI